MNPACPLRVQRSRWRFSAYESGVPLAGAAESLALQRLRIRRAPCGCSGVVGAPRYLPATRWSAAGCRATWEAYQAVSSCTATMPLPTASPGRYPFHQSRQLAPQCHPHPTRPCAGFSLMVSHDPNLSDVDAGLAPGADGASQSARACAAIMVCGEW